MTSDFCRRPALLKAGAEWSYQASLPATSAPTMWSRSCPRATTTTLCACTVSIP